MPPCGACRQAGRLREEVVWKQTRTEYSDNLDINRHCEMMSDLMRLQEFYEAVRVWTLCAFIGGILGIGLSVYGYFAKKRFKNAGILLVGHMFLCGLILAALNEIFLNKAKEQLLELLREGMLTVKICNVDASIEERNRIVSEIRLLKDIPRHHSQPLDTIPIEIIQDNESIRLRIQRDSERKNEYWIYWDRYKITSENAIGYIQTSKFDTISCD